MVAKMPSIWVVLAIATQQDWEMHQVDVKSAYLNALLDEEVYMLPPARIHKHGEENVVCKLKKVLYRLKQASYEWQKTLAAVFTNKLGFKQSAINHSIFFWCRGEEHTIIAVGTDNMAVTSGHTSDITKFKKRNTRTLCDSWWWQTLLVPWVQNQTWPNCRDCIYQPVELHWDNGQKILTYQFKASHDADGARYMLQQGPELFNTESAVPNVRHPIHRGDW